MAPAPGRQRATGHPGARESQLSQNKTGGKNAGELLLNSLRVGEAGLWAAEDPTVEGYVIDPIRSGLHTGGWGLCST